MIFAAKNAGSSELRSHLFNRPTFSFSIFFFGLSSVSIDDGYGFDHAIDLFL
jgi:hypothetical protein